MRPMLYVARDGDVYRDRHGQVVIRQESPGVWRLEVDGRVVSTHSTLTLARMRAWAVAA